MQFRRTALAAVPTWALVLLALLLAAGTAYAAFKVVTMWALPALEQAQEPDAGEEVEAEAEDAEAEETAEVEEAEEELDDEQLMYQLYYKKCQEYLELYGEPGVAEGELSGYPAYAAYGLAGIQLIDFDGDGIDELLLVYCTESDTLKDEGVSGTTPDVEEGYLIEVWHYADEAITQVYSGKVAYSHGNCALYVELSNYEDKLCIYTNHWEDGDNGYEYYYDSWSAMGEDGVFETLLSQYLSFLDEGDKSYLVDGESATSDEFAAAYEELVLVHRYILWTNAADTFEDELGDVSAEDLVKSSQETLELLATYQED